MRPDDIRRVNIVIVCFTAEGRWMHKGKNSRRTFNTRKRAIHITLYHIAIKMSLASIFNPLFQIQRFNIKKFKVRFEPKLIECCQANTHTVRNNDNLPPSGRCVICSHSFRPRWLMKPLISSQCKLCTSRGLISKERRLPHVTTFKITVLSVFSIMASS